MYQMYKSELLSQYKSTILNLAIKSWQMNDLDNDTISNKISELSEILDKTSKKQFIAIYKSYTKCF